MYQGDYLAASTVVFNFNTAAFSDGSPVTLAGTPALSVYKNSTTESTTGITLTVDYDSRTGMHHVAIDTSADGTFYAAGNDFDVIITTGTVGGTSVVGRKVGSFSLENRCQKADVRKLLGTAWLTPAVAGTPDVNAKQIGGTAQTGRDIGASVLLSNGAGAGQISLSAGAVTVGTNNDKSGYSLAVAPPTSAAIATAVWQDATAGDFTVASSIGKSLFTSGAVPGAAGGLFIAGSNAATTVNFTGNLSGSVGSVTGAVASVTGNVGGSVLSVTNPVTLTSGERDAVADAHLDRANGIETGVTPRQVHRGIAAALAGQNTGAGTGTEVFKAANNAGTTRTTYVIDAAGNRTSVTLNW